MKKEERKRTEFLPCYYLLLRESNEPDGGEERCFPLYGWWILDLKSFQFHFSCYFHSRCLQDKTNEDDEDEDNDEDDLSSSFSFSFYFYFYLDADTTYEFSRLEYVVTVWLITPNRVIGSGLGDFGIGLLSVVE